MNTILPKTPSNIPGRAPVHLSEEADDEIRYHFHLLLAEKIYPTIAILLERLLLPLQIFRFAHRQLFEDTCID